MSETNGVNGNGNGWMRTVLVALATLALGGGVGATTLRDAQTITPAEVTAMKVFEAETKLRLAAHDQNFEAINSKLDAIAAAQAKEKR